MQAAVRQQPSLRARDSVAAVRGLGVPVNSKPCFASYNRCSSLRVREHSSFILRQVLRCASPTYSKPISRGLGNCSTCRDPRRVRGRAAAGIGSYFVLTSRKLKRKVKNADQDQFFSTGIVFLNFKGGFERLERATGRKFWKASGYLSLLPAALPHPTLLRWGPSSILVPWTV